VKYYGLSMHINLSQHVAYCNLWEDLETENPKTEISTARKKNGETGGKNVLTGEKSVEIFVLGKKMVKLGEKMF
jgi:hypothetical protein